MMVKLHESRVEFRPDVHEYWLDGKQLDGYTSSIGKWMYPHTYDDVPRDILAAAAERGTMIHESIGLVDELGCESDVREVREYVRLREEKGLTPMSHEYIVSDESHFASAVDIVFCDGSIADVKTTSEVHLPEVTLQLSVYAHWLEAQNKGVRVPAMYCIWLPKEQYGACTIMEIPRIPGAIIKRVIKAYLAGESNEECLPMVAPRMPAVFNRFVRQYAQMEAKLEELKRQEAQVKENILRIFSGMGYKSYKDDSISITRVLPYERKSVDTDKLRKQHPGVYEECLKRSMTEESIRITLSKKK